MKRLVDMDPETLSADEVRDIIAKGSRNLPKYD